MVHHAFYLVGNASESDVATPAMDGGEREPPNRLRMTHFSTSDKDVYLSDSQFRHSAYIKSRIQNNTITIRGAKPRWSYKRPMVKLVRPERGGKNHSFGTETVLPTEFSSNLYTLISTSNFWHLRSRFNTPQPLLPHIFILTSEYVESSRLLRGCITSQVTKTRGIWMSSSITSKIKPILHPSRSVEMECIDCL